MLLVSIANVMFAQFKGVCPKSKVQPQDFYNWCETIDEINAMDMYDRFLNDRFLLSDYKIFSWMKPLIHPAIIRMGDEELFPNLVDVVEEKFNPTKVKFRGRDGVMGEVQIDIVETLDPQSFNSITAEIAAALYLKDTSEDEAQNLHCRKEIFDKALLNEVEFEGYVSKLYNYERLPLRLTCSGAIFGKALCVEFDKHQFAIEFWNRVRS